MRERNVYVLSAVDGVEARSDDGDGGPRGGVLRPAVLDERHQPVVVEPSAPVVAHLLTAVRVRVRRQLGPERRALATPHTIHYVYIHTTTTRHNNNNNDDDKQICIAP